MYISYLQTLGKCGCELEVYRGYDELLPNFIIWNGGESCDCDLCGDMPITWELGYYSCAGKCECKDCECIVR